MNWFVLSILQQFSSTNFTISKQFSHILKIKYHPNHNYYQHTKIRTDNMKNMKLKGMVLFLLLFLLVGVASASEDNATDAISIPQDTQDTIEVSSEANEDLTLEDNTNEPLTAEDKDILKDNSSSTEPEKVTPKIAVSKITGYQGKSLTLKATVKNGDVGVSGVKVTFKLNGNTYTNTTDSNGVAKYNIKFPKSSVLKTTSKTKGKTLTKTTYYQSTYTCDVTVTGTGYNKATDSFKVVSKKKPLVKKYKIIKKKKTRTIKVKSGVRTYTWGKYVAVTYKHNGGYGKIVETAMGKKNSGFIKFFVKHHYKKQNGNWKWDKWGKVPKGYSDEFTFTKNVKFDKIKVKYTQVTYKRIK